jgi:hypothetical protein
MSSCQLGHSFSVSLCAFGSEIELGLKDHVVAAYYAPSIGWSFSLSHVREALLGPPNQPPSQQAAAVVVVVVVVVVMVLHMTLTLDISFLLLPSISRREPCQIVHNLFFEFGR